MKTIRYIAPALLMVAVLVALALGIGLMSRDGRRQPDATPADDTPNTALSNSELISAALENMETLEKYGIDVVAVEPAGAITPTSHLTLTGYEQPGKGIALSARGKNTVSTYSVVSILAMEAAQFPYEMIKTADTEGMYISVDRGNTWKVLSGQAAGYFFPPDIVLCSWGATTASADGVEWVMPSCAEMIRRSQFEDAEPRTEMIDGVPARHLTADLLAAMMSSDSSFPVPFIVNDQPEGLRLHVWITTGATPRVVRMRFDLTSGKEAGQGVIAPFLAVAFSPDGKLLAGAHMSAGAGSPGLPQEEGTLMVWDLTRPDGPAVRLGKWYGDHFWDVEFSPDGKVLAAAGSRGICIWDVTNLGADPTILTIPGNVSLPPIAFSPDGKVLAAAGSSDGIYVWDRPYTGNPRLVIAEPATKLAFSPDSRTLAASGSDGVRLYNVVDWTPTPVILYASGSVPAGQANYRTDSLAFSPDGRLLAVSRESNEDSIPRGEVHLWDVSSLDEPLVTFPSGGSTIAFSPDGKYLATEGGQVWEVAAIRSEGAKASPLVIEGICGNAPAFSPDSRKLAVACYENSVQVWDVTDMAQAGKPIVLLRDPADTNKLTYSLTLTWSRFNDDSIEVKPPATETIKQP